MLQDEFATLLHTLAQGRVVVNLPSYTRGIVHRVPEALAAGRVVLTNRLADRPRTMEWLEANPGVFLYETPDELRRTLASLVAEPELARESALKGAEFTRDSGSAEARLQAALSWIERTSAPTDSGVALTSSEWLLSREFEPPVRPDPAAAAFRRTT